MTARRYPIRLAVRGIVVHDNRLLLVNAWPDDKSDLLCVPGGGVEPHQSLPDNLAREIHEETGLTVAVHEPVLVNEFHNPSNAFHQVDVYFRCTIVSGDPFGEWVDPEGVVTRRAWVTRDEMATLRVKPDSLAAVVWDHAGVAAYDALELLVR